VLFIFNRHLIIIVTITNLTGDTISWLQQEVQGSKELEKSTPLLLKQRQALEALSTGMKNVEILVKDKVQDEKAIRAIEGAGFDIISIQDITSVPHNGCRPKRRRV
jgi:small subunit ribosomal protein S11